jgi:hypothetical protein
MYKCNSLMTVEAAADNDFRVMRIWGSLDIGDERPSTSRAGGRWCLLQYWDARQARCP